MTLTKSGFLEHRACAKAHWLMVNRPGEVAKRPPSEFARMLMRQGYAVEAMARDLVAGWPDAARCQFQVTFEADGLEARADLVRRNTDDSIDLFEIKASTSIKGSTGDHVVDAGFQALVAERGGATVGRVHIIHVNKEYERSGPEPVDPAGLLVIVDVSEKVLEQRAGLEQEIDAALVFLATPDLDEDGCSCLFVGSPDNHCAAFDRFNPGIASPSLYILPRISTPKLKKFHEEGRFSLAAVTPADLSARQALVHRAALEGAPVIDRDAIANFVNELTWPIYFYDYETFASAIPIATGHRPHEQIPVQFSVHRLDATGTLTHFEYLADAPGLERPLIEALEACIGFEGSIVSWHMSTEVGCNERLARLVPEKKAFLEGLNARTRDLLVPFEEKYVDARFEGSTSIKKVLPVLVPGLSYSKTDVHDGTGAMDAWQKLISSGDASEKAELRRQLLAYCKLDTLAMVEIFKVLRASAANA